MFTNIWKEDVASVGETFELHRPVEPWYKSEANGRVTMTLRERERSSQQGGARPVNCEVMSQAEDGIRVSGGQVHSHYCDPQSGREELDCTCMRTHNSPHQGTILEQKGTVTVRRQESSPIR